MQAHKIIRPGDPEPAPQTHAFRGDPRGLPTLVNREVVRHGGTPQRLFQQYIEPESGAEHRAATDLLIARKTNDILESTYPGHLWSVVVSSKQGVVRIGIPVLMGANWWFIIRWQDMSPHRVILAGGEILERYGLRRGEFELGSFLDARQKHGIPNKAAEAPPE
jgi:hypothetical protein